MNFKGEDPMPRRRGFSGGRRLFEEFVKEAVDSLPEEMKKELENMAILVEDEPPEDWEEEMGQGGSCWVYTREYPRKSGDSGMETSSRTASSSIRSLWNG